MGEKHVLRLCLGGLCAALFLVGLAACADVTSLLNEAHAPGITLPPQFQWHADDRPSSNALSIPTTSRAPGPAISLHVAHDTGFGAPIQSAHVMLTAATVGQQVIAAEVGRLKAQGWQPLFTPTVTGSYPAYVLYVTLRSGTHYCFVEFSATALTSHVASQELDIFHN